MFGWSDNRFDIYLSVAPYLGGLTIGMIITLASPMFGWFDNRYDIYLSVAPCLGGLTIGIYDSYLSIAPCLGGLVVKITVTIERKPTGSTRCVKDKTHYHSNEYSLNFAAVYFH